MFWLTSSASVTTAISVIKCSDRGLLELLGFFAHECDSGFAYDRKSGVQIILEHGDLDGEWDLYSTSSIYTFLV